MSFILDALKKSDAERQRNTGPTLAEVPRTHRPPQRPWWVFALGALLVVNLIIFAVVLLRGSHSSAPVTPPPSAAAETIPAPVAAAPAKTAPTQVAAAPAPTPAPVQNSTVAHPPVPSRSLADEAAISAPTDAEQTQYAANLAAASNVPDRAPIVKSNSAPDGSTIHAPSTNSNQEALPTINELAPRATQGLPDMHMDIHVYALSPQNRFISINGRKYTEGQKLAEGPTVESITREGAVLNHQGLRFLLVPQ